MPKIERIEDASGDFLPLRVTRRKERKTSPNLTLSPSIRVKCGCCNNAVVIHYEAEGASEVHLDAPLEINGVNGTVDQWRKVLLPLLGM